MCLPMKRPNASVSTKYFSRQIKKLQLLFYTVFMNIFFNTFNQLIKYTVHIISECSDLSYSGVIASEMIRKFYHKFSNIKNVFGLEFFRKTDHERIKRPTTNGIKKNICYRSAKQNDGNDMQVQYMAIYILYNISARLYMNQHVYYHGRIKGHFSLFKKKITCF